jgi:hypothetical protein
MERIDTLMLDGPDLTKAERLEIFRLQQLFARAPKGLQSKAMERINPMLESGRIDSRRLMAVVRDVSKDLREALKDIDE